MNTSSTELTNSGLAEADDRQQIAALQKQLQLQTLFTNISTWENFLEI